MQIQQLLFSPFEKLGNNKALIIGFVIIILTAIAGWFTNVRFNGIIDIHLSEARLSLIAHLVEALLMWLLFAAVLFATGSIISRTKINLLTILGYQALARWPYLFAPVLFWIFPVQKMYAYFMYQYFGLGEALTVTTFDMVLMVLFSILIVLLTIWMIALMYRAYTISCHVKGVKGVISFIFAIIVAELLSKLFLLPVYSYLG
jgi:hypothetical protein